MNKSAHLPYSSSFTTSSVSNFDHTMGLYTELTDAILEVDVIIAGGKLMHTFRRCSLLSSANMKAFHDQVVPQAVSSLRGWQMRMRVCLFSS